MVLASLLYTYSMNLGHYLKSNKFLRRISLFDGIIISTILIIGISFFLFFYRKPQYVQIRVKVTEQDVLRARVQPDAWYANQFSVGDVERDALGRKSVEVINVESFPVDEKKKAVYLDLNVMATYDSRTKLYYIKGKKLIFGSPIRFNLSQVTFDGYVTEFPGAEMQNLKHEYRSVIVLERSIEPQIAEAIHIGDKITNSRNTLLAEVLGINNNPAERVTVTAAGEPLLKLDPLYRDIYLTLKMRTTIFRNEVFVFDNIPLKIGEIIPLSFPKVNLYSLQQNITPYVISVQ